MELLLQELYPGPNHPLSQTIQKGRRHIFRNHIMMLRIITEISSLQ